jgi:hypothetical protein
MFSPMSRSSRVGVPWVSKAVLFEANVCFLISTPSRPSVCFFPLRLSTDRQITTALPKSSLFMSMCGPSSNAAFGRGRPVSSTRWRNITCVTYTILLDSKEGVFIGPWFFEDGAEVYLRW